MKDTLLTHHKGMYVLKQLSNHDPYYNMAVDEYFTKHRRLDEPLIIFNINEKSVIIGRNQNVIEEVNMEKCKELGVKICRRFTGGGAVYHDLGNVSFTIVDRSGPGKDYAYFSQPIIKALAALGINARFHGRNDLLIGEQKISGAAQYVYKDTILHHATLLYSVDLSVLGTVLTPHVLKVQSHATKSNPSRVTLISRHYLPGVSCVQFAERLADYFLGQAGAQILVISKQDETAIQELVREKYATWEWIYGQGATYDYKNKQKFAGGLIELGLNTEMGRIAAIKFSGDFLSKTEVSNLERSMVGMKVTKEDLTEFFGRIVFGDYFGSLSVEEVVSLFPFA